VCFVSGSWNDFEIDYLNMASYMCLCHRRRRRHHHRHHRQRIRYVFVADSHVTVSILHFTVCLIFVLCQQADCNLSYPKQSDEIRQHLIGDAFFGFGKKIESPGFPNRRANPSLRTAGVSPNLPGLGSNLQMEVLHCHFDNAHGVLPIDIMTCFLYVVFYWNATCNFSVSHKAQNSAPSLKRIVFRERK